MADLKDLATRLNKYADKVEAAPSKVAALVAIDLVDALTDLTPVDTTKAISNWLLSLDEPILSELDAYFEGEFGSTRYKSKKSVLDFAKLKVAPKKPGQNIFISNSAPYIRDLENGTSQQAPTGFTKQAVAVARAKIKKHFKEVMKHG